MCSSPLVFSDVWIFFSFREGLREGLCEEVLEQDRTLSINNLEILAFACSKIVVHIDSKGDDDCQNNVLRNFEVISLLKIR